jgi:hypothetical protein
MSLLEIASWIAGIAAVPVAIILAVVGWSRSGRQHNANQYERRYAILQAISAALNEALCNKLISDETYRSFSRAVTDARFVVGDARLVAYLNSVRDRAAKFQAITISMDALPPGAVKAGASAAAGKERLWLIDQIDGLPKRFEPVLQP